MFEAQCIAHIWHLAFLLEVIVPLFCNELRLLQNYLLYFKMSSFSLNY